MGIICDYKYHALSMVIDLLKGFFLLSDSPIGVENSNYQNSKLYYDALIN